MITVSVCLQPPYGFREKLDSDSRRELSTTFLPSSSVALFSCRFFQRHHDEDPKHRHQRKSQTVKNRTRENPKSYERATDELFAPPRLPLPSVLPRPKTRSSAKRRRGEGKRKKETPKEKIHQLEDIEPLSKNI